MRPVGRLIPGLAAAAVFAVVAICERQLAIGVCGGEYVYPIDDTYIHIAMAKTLATDGTWGVEAGRLAFCSSSPLWTLVLGGLYAVVGVRETLPWLLALLFNLGAIVLVERTVASLTDDWRLRIGGALAVAVAGPFVCTTALGMEHAMHGFLMLAAVVASAALPEGRGGVRGTSVACLCAAAAVGSRYESLFLLLPLGVGLCGLEVWRRWAAGQPLFPLRSVAFLAAAGTPVLVYGAWAVAAGGHFLPNSLLLKGSFRTLPEIVRELSRLLGFVRPGCGFLYVLAATLAVVACVCRTTPFWRVAAASTVVAIGGQLLFAGVGQLCRYEAYLTATGAFVVLCCALGGVGLRPRAYASIAALCLAGIVFLGRGSTSFAEVVKASSDIRCQQVLMTRMLAVIPEEDRGCIALNDLGYMALHGGFPFVDIWGLGSQDVTELLLRHPGTWIRADYEKIFREHDVRYVAVFENWYPRALMPGNTEDVAYLTLKDNTTCGGDTVVFRATSPESAGKLRRHLLKFRDGLPPRVTLRVL